MATAIITVPLCSGERIDPATLKFDDVVDVVTFNSGAFRGTYECTDDTSLFFTTTHHGTVRTKEVPVSSTLYRVNDPTNDEVKVEVEMNSIFGEQEPDD